MTRKDFQLIATVLHDADMDAVTRFALIQAFIPKLAASNAAFDAARFYDAAWRPDALNGAV